MKPIIKSKKVVLMIIGIIFTLSTITSNNPDFNVSSGEKSTIHSDFVNLYNDNLQISKVSGIIHIVGNSGWINFRNDGNCTGSGTFSDPYIIKDLKIDGGGSNNSIWVENSTVYFRIENCTLYNSGGWFSGGIKLTNTTNGNLVNNNCSSNDHVGIFLWDSVNNTISGNNINKNEKEGIALYYSSHNNVISENDVSSNSFGIAILNSDFNNISGNNVFNHSGGIALHMANNNHISGNIANNNTSYGISLIWSNFTYVFGNIASSNLQSGIVTEYSVYNTISGNKANYNMDGIKLSYSDYSTITGNVINDTTRFGIWLYDCDYNTISCNSLTGNDIHINEEGGCVGNMFRDNDSCIEGEDVPKIPGIPGYNIFFLICIFSFGIILFVRKMKFWDKPRS